MLQTVLQCTEFCSLSRNDVDSALYVLHRRACCREAADRQSADADRSCIHVADGDLDLLSGQGTYLKVLAGEGSIDQVHGIELSRGLNPVDLAGQLIHFVLDRGTVRRGVRVVCCLSSQLVHTLKNAVGFVQRTLCYLDQRDAVLCVRRCLVKTTDLVAHFFRNRKTCCVVACTVDTIARRKLLSGLRLRACRDTKLSVGIRCLHVVLYYHNFSSLKIM